MVEQGWDCSGARESFHHPQRLSTISTSLNNLYTMITLIVGTNRRNSKSKAFAQYYQSHFESMGAETRLLDLSELPDDFIRSALYENNGKDADFNELRSIMRDSEKYVFVVPEYNGSFPGVLKAFLDGMGYPSELNYKKAALVGLSDGVMGGAMALSHLIDILNYMGCTVLAQRVRVPFMKKNFAEGKLQDALIEKLMLEQIELLVKM
jgi:chromate reductase, NAD(P)H dehydrogenase (quinone)